jgi:hypothetical protein
MRGLEQQLLLCAEVAGTPSVGVSEFLDDRAGILKAFMLSMAICDAWLEARPTDLASRLQEF